MADMEKSRRHVIYVEREIANHFANPMISSIDRLAQEEAYSFQHDCLMNSA